MSDAQIAVHSAGEPMCTDHRKLASICCATCKHMLICSDCVAEKHNRHEFANVKQLAHEKRGEIRSYVQLGEKKTQELADFQNKMLHVMTNIKKQKQVTVEYIRKRKAILIEEIEKVASALENDALLVKNSNAAKLLRAKQEGNRASGDLLKFVEDCKHLLGDSISDLNLLAKSDLFRTHLNEIGSEDITFHTTEQVFEIPQNVPELGSIFGHINTSVVHGDTVSILESGCTSNANGEEFSTGATLTNIFREVARFNHEPNVAALSTTTDGHVWLSCMESLNVCSKKITLVNQTGDVQNGLQLKHSISDVTSANDDTVMVCCLDGSVCEIRKDGSFTVLFKTDAYPTGLCINNEGHVIACFYGSGVIKKYTKEGKLLKKLDATTKLHLSNKPNRSGFFGKFQSDSGQITEIKVESPHKIAADKTSGTLAITNKPKNKPKSVIVTDNYLNIKFHFNGTSASCDLEQTELEPVKRFSPNNVAFANNGDIIIANGNGSRVIMLLDSTGQYVRTLLSDQEMLVSVLSVDVDHDGRIWAGYMRGDVKVFEYT